MYKFPEELNESSIRKIIIDKSRFLVGLKQPHKIEEIINLLQRTEFVLEEVTGIQKNNERHRSMDEINHTDKRYWIRSSNHEPMSEENLDTLKEVFGEELDWVGPVYQSPTENGRRGLYCPLPNILIIKFTSTFNDKDNEFSQKLAGLNMKEVPEESTYLNEYRYYIISNIENGNAYQIKDILENDTQFIRQVLFEDMPMIIPTSFIPNDPLFRVPGAGGQWNMERIQAGGSGTTAWDLSTGNDSVVICVLDSGCDLTHTDLQFIAGGGIRLDTMGPDGSPIVPPTITGTDAAHGTACAGIAAATFNNLLGVAGVAGSCRIMPLAFHNWEPREFARGINFATDNGAQVISMSITMGWTSQEQRDIMDAAIQHAYENNIVLCAATGNFNTVIDYPANLWPFVMACGASDQLDNRQSPTSPIQWSGGRTGSNFGPEISVVAPGIQIPTTDRVGSLGFNQGGDYCVFDGTSAATPHVAGLAGLLRSIDSTLTNFEVRNIIERTADKVGTAGYSGGTNGGWNNEMGYGRINALRALQDPGLDWFREIVVSGTMDIENEEFPKNIYTFRTFSPSGTTSTVSMGPTVTGPFLTHVEIPWIERDDGDEIRIEVLLILDWRMDSSVDVKWNVKLFEGTSADTDDLDGERSGTITIPKDTTRPLDVVVTNTEEDDDDSVELKLKISNNRYKRP